MCEDIFVSYHVCVCVCVRRSTSCTRPCTQLNKDIQIIQTYQIYMCMYMCEDIFVLCNVCVCVFATALRARAPAPTCTN